ncbi:unnamed protein product [Chrysoparadoxa australica]
MVLKHIISVRIEDELGVFTRIASLFGRKGFNIESFAIGPSEQIGILRISMVIISDEIVANKLIEQLYKILNVLSIENLTSKAVLQKELMLIKVSCTNINRSQILELVKVFNTKVVDISERELTIEVVGDSGKIAAIEKLLEPFGIVEIARTGSIALSRSSMIDSKALITSPMHTYAVRNG